MLHYGNITDRTSGFGGRVTTMRPRVLSALTILLLFGSALPTWAGGNAPLAIQAMDAVVHPASGATLVGGVRRRSLTVSVAEYSFRLRVGPGAYDVIGLHRVVKERKPFVPIQTSQAVLMAHGDIWGFDAAFLASLASTTIPNRQALAVFLAQNNIDVWGIDFRWTLVPFATVDFSFMKQWDLGTDVKDLRTALLTARLTRLVTGSGFGRIHLLGWSRGGQTGYAYLSAETQSPIRHVKGFIPVDIFMKTDKTQSQSDACARFAMQQARIDAGTFHDETGILLSQLGGLAVTAPANPSPILAGLTNFQAALFFGTNTYELFKPVPFYHFVGAPAGAGLPATLLYTQEAYWLDFLQGTAPYEPVQILAQGEALVCDEIDLPFDDHLGDITVPVLYVGAGGGFGAFGIHTTTLLGSTDISSHIITLDPDRAEDFGHADLFLADNARVRVWQPILRWLKSH